MPHSVIVTMSICRDGITRFQRQSVDNNYLPHYIVHYSFTSSRQQTIWNKARFEKLTNVFSNEVRIDSENR